MNKYTQRTFIFTDGSKTETMTSFAVTSEDKVICTSILPDYSSVFSAEIIAIHEAIKCCKKAGKYAICTDSLSSIHAITNPSNNNFYAANIRTSLIQLFPKFIIIWIPGHSLIKGNEFADDTAKQASRSPLIKTTNINYSDIYKYVKKQIVERNSTIWNLTNNWYKITNNNKNNIYSWAPDSNNIRRMDLVKIIRLRLGHTRMTHEHITRGSHPPICDCNNYTPLTIAHIFNSCPKFEHHKRQHFGNIEPLTLLSSPKEESIRQILNFLKTTKLYNKI